MLEPEAQDGAPEESSAVAVDLGALLQAATALEEAAEDAALSTVHQALAMQEHPDALELARLTDALVSHCSGLAVGVETIPEGQRPQRGHGALRDWAQLKADGPGDGPLGPWSYARQLALVARNMIRAMQEHRAAQRDRPPFVGRPGLPPLTPTAP